MQSSQLLTSLSNPFPLFYFFLTRSLFFTLPFHLSKYRPAWLPLKFRDRLQRVRCMFACKRVALAGVSHTFFMPLAGHNPWPPYSLSYPFHHFFPSLLTTLIQERCGKTFMIYITIYSNLFLMNSCIFSYICCYAIIFSYARLLCVIGSHFSIGFRALF